MIKYFIGSKIQLIANDFSQDSKRLVALAMARAKDPSDRATTATLALELHEDLVSAIFRLLLLSESFHSIQIHILLHSVMSSALSMIISSDSQQYHESILMKIKAINNICENIEHRTKHNITSLLNANAHALSNEIKLFNETTRAINAYMSVLANRLVLLSSSLLFIMLSLAFMIAVLVVYTMYPDYKGLTRYLPSVVIDNLISRNYTNRLLSSTIAMQLIIVSVVVLAGNGSSYIRDQQQKALSRAVSDAKSRILSAKLLYVEATSRRNHRYDIPVGTVIAYAGSLPKQNPPVAMQSSPSFEKSPERPSKSAPSSSSSSSPMKKMKPSTITSSREDRSISPKPSIKTGLSLQLDELIEHEIFEYWLPCEGQELNISDYPDLFQAIQGLYGKVSNGKFYLPDYRSCTLEGNSSYSGLGLGEEAYRQSMPLKNRIPGEAHEINVKSVGVNYLIRVKF
jgi:hypothetical protein